MERGGIEGSDIDTQGNAKKDEKSSVCGMDTPSFSNPSFEMSQRKTTRLYFFNKHCYQSGADLKFLTPLLEQSVNCTN